MLSLILAAGASRRLHPLTLDRPKCLLEVGGRAIIDHQIDALARREIRAVHIVVGYYREMLMDHLRRSWPRMDFHFHINQRFFETNTAASVHLALPHLAGKSLLLMNGDVVYPPELLARLLDAPSENAFAVEAKACGEEEVKVVASSDGRITEIGKQLDPNRSLGEFIGVAKISEPFGGAFAGSLADLIQAGGESHYFEAAIQPLCEKHRLQACDISDLACIEIDFPEDLETARLAK